MLGQDEELLEIGERRRDRRQTWGLWGDFIPIAERDMRIEVSERTLADGSIRIAPELLTYYPRFAPPSYLTDPATAHVRSVVCSDDHCAVVREDGTVVAWGDEFFAQGQTVIPSELQDSARPADAVSSSPPGLYYAAAAPLGGVDRR